MALQSLSAYCEQNGRWELLDQWDGDRNGGLTPADVPAGTLKKVWWRCPLGHGYQAAVASRASLASGCPYCAGQRVLPGFNDLATRYPDLAAQWDTERNGDLVPWAVTVSSNRRVWWRCPQSHSYQAPVAARTGRETGCPYCAGRRVLPGFNDLATRYPDLAAQWDQEGNGARTPQDVTPGSHYRAWWRCQSGHRWQAAVFSRTGSRPTGCPACAAGADSPRRLRYRALSDHRNSAAQPLSDR